MMNSDDLYAFTVTTPLNSIGTSIIRYEIRRYRDIRNLGDNLAYQVLCTHRVIIPNQTSYVPGSINTTAFNSYPAVIANNITIANAVTGAPAPGLINYSPRTLNSAIVTSTNQSGGSSNAASQQHTSGSSTSQSNSFGASASIGFFGELLTGGLSVDYQHGWGSEKSESNTAGSEIARNKERSSGESMSVKDWGCYSYTDVKDQTPTWVWGQEYPWDVIQFRNSTSGSQITLPEFVQAALYDGIQVYPPSQLSLFGVDFTMKSLWIVEPPATALTQTETVSLTHTTNYYTASHSVLNGKLQASINSAKTISYTSPAIDLSTYALDPILTGNSGNDAVIGFAANKLIIQPAPEANFKAISSANNLQVTGTGFQFTGSGIGSTMSASFTGGAAATLKIQFKIVDDKNDYTLFLKHWNGVPAGCTLSIVINGDTQNPIVKHVDALEAQGGDNNMTSISLRNHDFASIDYHDYLNYGLNTIAITITPNDPSNSVYVLKAIAISS